MTIRCMDCKTLMREVCPWCGSSAYRSPYHFDKTLCSKKSCDFLFNPGDGGTSHGLCEKCLPLRLAECLGRNKSTPIPPRKRQGSEQDTPPLPKPPRPIAALAKAEK